MYKNLICFICLLLGGPALTQSLPFGGLDNSMGNLPRMSTARTRSISPENLTGGKGQGSRVPLEKGTAREAASELGTGWKVNPYLRIEPGQTQTLADIDGPGAIQHMWMATIGGIWRYMIVRIYWDDEKTPSVEVPMADFFCSGWGKASPLTSLAVCVNPRFAFNCYWTMPFRKKARITLENIHNKPLNFYYQVDYTLTEVPADMAYFHAQFRRVNPLPFKQPYVLLDGVKGRGQYVGTYMAWGVHTNRWWGEGEIKFYMDGDTDYPTINGTGTEDYFCGSHNFESATSERPQYQEFTTPYSGLHQVIKGDGLYNVAQRFGMYRWHIVDPIRFEKELKVTIQALGWKSEFQAYLPLQDDIASTVFWYQTEPHAPFPPLPEKAFLEVN